MGLFFLLFCSFGIFPLFFRFHAHDLQVQIYEMSGLVIELERRTVVEITDQYILDIGPMMCPVLPGYRSLERP